MARWSIRGEADCYAGLTHGPQSERARVELGVTAWAVTDLRSCFGHDTNIVVLKLRAVCRCNIGSEKTERVHPPYRCCAIGVRHIPNFLRPFCQMRVDGDVLRVC